MSYAPSPKKFLVLALVAASSGVAAAADGEEVYRRVCAACHGKYGKGLMQGQVDFTDPQTWITMNLAGVVNYTERGAVRGGLVDASRRGKLN